MKLSHMLPAILSVVGASFGLSAPSAAQTPSDFTIVASGLNAPRGLKFGPDGVLYVAEGGKGGTTATTSAQCEQVPGPVGPYKGGSTGDIVKIVSGKAVMVASGFPSTVAATGDLDSVADIAFLNGQLYALIAGGGCSHGNINAPNGIAKVDAKSGKWSMIADLSAFALAHPGKYDNAGDFEPDGVWFSLVPRSDKLLAIEPNRGVIAAVKPGSPPQEFMDISASQGHIVPTAMAVHDSDVYVGNLLYFPILPQWSRILRISPVTDVNDDSIDGFGVIDHYVALSKAGFSTVMAINFGPDGLLYVLELSDVAGFPAPGLGKVVRVKHSGDIEEVITGLNVPGGMTWGSDGRLYISDFSAVPAPGYGAGRVLRFDIAPGF